MTEDEAKQWIADRYDNAAVDKLSDFVALIHLEATRQNLISASTIDTIWHRHVVDSAQLLPLAGDDKGVWADIGSGAGFPGLVIAILRQAPMVLVEPRRLRVDFLRAAADQLHLNHVTTELAKAQNVAFAANVISARAVASVTKLIDASHHLTTPETKWLLPKGLHAREEVAEARRSWHGTFHVEHSVTDPNSMIVVAQGISRR